MMRNHKSETAKDGTLAAGGLLGAVGASSCCILPLALALAGVSGAWIGGLTRLAPYQPIFLSVGAIAVGTGLWRAYRRTPCEGPQCGTVRSRRWTRALLWLSSVLLLIAATTTWWAQLLI